MDKTAFRWLFNINYKDIGTLYFILGSLSGLLGTLLSVLIRLELNTSGNYFFQGNHQLYNIVVTAHALLMIFFPITYILNDIFRIWLIPVMSGVLQDIYAHPFKVMLKLFFTIICCAMSIVFFEKLNAVSCVALAEASSQINVVTVQFIENYKADWALLVETGQIGTPYLPKQNWEYLKKSLDLFYGAEESVRIWNACLELRNQIMHEFLIKTANFPRNSDGFLLNDELCLEELRLEWQAFNTSFNFFIRRPISEGIFLDE